MACALAFLVGLALGSFLNVVITRLPRGEQVMAGRSRCPHCRTTLPWRDNLPLLSYLWLGGRCRFCGAPISRRYPLVELAGGPPAGPRRGPLCFTGLAGFIKGSAAGRAWGEGTPSCWPSSAPSWGSSLCP